MAAQYLNAGDQILQLERRNASDLYQSEIEHILERDGKSLHLVVRKSPPNRAHTESRKIYSDRRSYSESSKPSSRCSTPYEFNPIIQLGLSDVGRRSPFISMSTDEDVDIDLHVEYKQTYYDGKPIPRNDTYTKDYKREVNNLSSNQKRMQLLSKNFFRDCFPEKKDCSYDCTDIPKHVQKEKAER